MGADVSGLKKRNLNAMKKILYISYRKVVESILGTTNFILALLDMQILNKREIEYTKTQSKTLALFYDNIISDENILKKGVGCVIFSMDRPMQLHALLGSLLDKLSSPIPIFVIYRYTNEKYEETYKNDILLYSDKLVTFVKQGGEKTFKDDLIKVLWTIDTDRLFFLVDDILVTEYIDTQDLGEFDCERGVLSLRLGMNLQASYNAREAQPLPTFIPQARDDGKIFWIWNKGKYDWNYPLSVDGHVFSTKEMLAMTRSISFNSPNTFESNLQIFRPVFDFRYGLAYNKSRLFNIPCNKVQNDNTNRHGKMHQDELLKKWNEGYQIDYKSVYGFQNTGAHQEIAFNFIKRINDK